MGEALSTGYAEVRVLVGLLNQVRVPIVVRAAKDLSKAFVHFGVGDPRSGLVDEVEDIVGWARKWLVIGWPVRRHATVHTAHRDSCLEEHADV